MLKNTKTTFSQNEQSTFFRGEAPQPVMFSQNREPTFRGVEVLPKIPIRNNNFQSSLGGGMLPTKLDQFTTLNKQPFNNSQKNNLFSTDTPVIHEKINVPKWRDSGEDTINLRNTFQTNLSAFSILDKLYTFLTNTECCDVTFHSLRGEIHGRKWNKENFDFASFYIWLYEYNTEIRVKMVRNKGCPFTFQTLLSNTFRHMAKVATTIDPSFCQPSNNHIYGRINNSNNNNNNTFGPLPVPMNLDLSLFGLEDFNIEWTEQEINNIIDEIENGYHESVHASCKQLAKESLDNHFLEKLCLIPQVIERFIRIASESKDVLVVHNILTTLQNIWKYSQTQSINYINFLGSLYDRWSDSQTIQLGQNQWTVDKSSEILRIIMESRRILCSA